MTTKLQHDLQNFTLEGSTRSNEYSIYSPNLNYEHHFHMFTTIGTNKISTGKWKKETLFKKFEASEQCIKTNSLVFNQLLHLTLSEAIFLSVEIFISPLDEFLIENFNTSGRSQIFNLIMKILSYFWTNISNPPHFQIKNQ